MWHKLVWALALLVVVAQANLLGQQGYQTNEEDDEDMRMAKRVMIPISKFANLQGLDALNLAGRPIKQIRHSQSSLRNKRVMIPFSKFANLPNLAALDLGRKPIQQFDYTKKKRIMIPMSKFASLTDLDALDLGGKQVKQFLSESSRAARSINPPYYPGQNQLSQDMMRLARQNYMATLPYLS